jgi:transposase InsO family protein
MHAMVLDENLKHMSVATLAIHAMRIGKLFASPATWRKLILLRGWKRPRTRVHPKPPRVGIRASAPNEIWHLDVTVTPLLDGTKAYLHAVIDNFCWKILGWKIAAKEEPQGTVDILVQAEKFLSAGQSPHIFMDSGVENKNAVVDARCQALTLERVFAKVLLIPSNSMIERFWQQLRHGWLFLHTLDSLAELERLTRWYVDQHNSVMPHFALDGQTPDEMYFGTGVAVPGVLAKAHAAARTERIEVNRKLHSCDPPPDQPAPALVPLEKP